MHLCCRDANHKHLYLLVNARTKTRVVEEGEKKKKKKRKKKKKEGKKKNRRRRRKEEFSFSTWVMKG